MSSIEETIKLLQEKFEDLQRDTKFCVNNYDYHHKNNEHEIIQNIEDILKDSLKDGQEYLENMKNVRSAIDKAHEKCLQIDKLLNDLGVNDNYDVTKTCPAEIKNSSEEHELSAEENKEN